MLAKSGSDDLDVDVARVHMATLNGIRLDYECRGFSLKGGVNVGTRKCSIVDSD